MRARAYLIPAALVLAGVVIALCTRFSYRDIGTEYLDFNYAGNIDANFLNDENNKTQGIHSADDLLARCDAAVLCTFTGKRQMTDEAMYQDMKVLEVLKGSESLKGTEITLVNVASVWFEERSISSLLVYCRYLKGTPTCCFYRSCPSMRTAGSTAGWKNSIFCFLNRDLACIIYR